MYASLLDLHKGKYQFVHLAGLYLPAKFSKIVSYLLVFELFFVLTTYIILAPTFFSVLFTSKDILILLLSWFVFTLGVFFNIKFLGVMEFAGTISILIIVAALFIVSVLYYIPQNKTDFDFSAIALLLPFGPLLFSLSGRPAISSIVEIHNKASAFKKQEFSLRKSIFWGTLIPAILYFVFVFSVLRINPSVTPTVFDSLYSLPNFFVLMLGVLGLVAIFTSYVMIGVEIKKIFISDFKIKKTLSLLIVALVPPLLYLVGFQNFIFVLAFTGGIFLAVEAICVLRMWQKAFPNHPLKKYSHLLYIIFFLSITYELLDLFGIIK